MKKFQSLKLVTQFTLMPHRAYTYRWPWEFDRWGWRYSSLSDFLDLMSLFYIEWWLAAILRSVCLEPLLSNCILGYNFSGDSYQHQLHQISEIQRCGWWNWLGNQDIWYCNSQILQTKSMGYWCSLEHSLSLSSMRRELSSLEFRCWQAAHNTHARRNWQLFAKRQRGIFRLHVGCANTVDPGIFSPVPQGPS